MTREDVVHAARVARFGLTDEEIDSLTSEIDHILEAMRALQVLDTSVTPPTAQVLSRHNGVRQDTTWKCSPWTRFCKTGPRRGTDSSWYPEFSSETRESR